MSPICSMKGLSRPNMGGVYCLWMQICCSRGPGADNTCEGQDFRDDTASRGGSTHQGGLRCNRNPHTQRFWSVSGGRRTAGERRGSSSCGTPENIAVWRLSRRAHTCRGGCLQQHRWGLFQTSWLTAQRQKLTPKTEFLTNGRWKRSSKGSEWMCFTDLCVFACVSSGRKYR